MHSSLHMLVKFVGMALKLRHKYTITKYFVSACCIDNTKLVIIFTRKTF